MRGLVGSCVFSLILVYLLLPCYASAPPSLSFVAVAYDEDPRTQDVGWELSDVGSDRFGNVYAAGTRWWKETETGASSGMPYAAKWDAQGTLVWQRIYDLGATDYGCLTAAVDADGFLYMGGSKGIHQYVLIKCDPNGDILWWKTRTGQDDDYYADIGVTSLRLDGEGNIICVGWAGRSLTQIVKYDRDGNELWAHCFSLAHTAVRGHLSSCGIDVNDNIYIGTNTLGDESEVDHISDIACYGTLLWLANNCASHAGGILILYDPNSYTILHTLPNPSPEGGLIRGVAWDGTALWVACSTSELETVFYRVHPETGAILRSIGPTAGEARGLDWGNGRLWYGDPASSIVVCLDAASGNPIASVPVPNGPKGVAYVSGGGGYLFVTGTENTYFVEIASGNVLSTSPQWISPQEGIAWDEDLLWTSNGGGLVGKVDLREGGYAVEPYLVFPSPSNPEDGRVTKLSPAGTILGSVELDLGPQEQVMALDGDSEGNIVAVSWLVGQSQIGLTMLDGDLSVLWSSLAQFPTPTAVPREISVGLHDKIYVAGRVGSKTDIWETDEDSHMFTLCYDREGGELWRDIYDAGGPTEKEWGAAASVSAGRQGGVYTGGSLSSSSTEWHWAFCVLSYEEGAFPTAAVFRVEPSGAVLADGSFYSPAFHVMAADVAEWVRVTEPVQPGDVLELDPTQPGSYRKARGLATTLVAGVVSTEPGFVLGSPTPYPLSTTHAQALLALSGIVPVKVTNEGGPIQPGDLLVSSSTPGYAMRWSGPEPCPCALVGKALDALLLGQGSGLVSVLLTAH